MTDKIVWHNFRNNEPPVVDFYLVQNVFGEVYLDQWIYDTYRCVILNEDIHRYRWEKSGNSEVYAWSKLGDITLREYIELVNGAA